MPMQLVVTIPASGLHYCFRPICGHAAYGPAAWPTARPFGMAHGRHDTTVGGTVPPVPRAVHGPPAWPMTRHSGSCAVTKPVDADVSPHRADSDNLKPEEELEIENDDDVHEDASVLFVIDLDDGSHPIDADVGGGVVELDPS